MPAALTPIDELDQSILNLCTRINAATYELLVMVREFDERGGLPQVGSRVHVEVAGLALRSVDGHGA